MSVPFPTATHRPEAGGHLGALPRLLHRPDDPRPQQIRPLQVSPRHQSVSSSALNEQNSELS